MKKQRTLLVNLGMAGILAGSLAMVACKDEGAQSGAGSHALAEKLEAVEKEQALLQKEIETMQAEKRGNAAEMEAARKAQEDRLLELQKELREIRNERDSLEAEFDAYREEYKVSVRQKANGIELGTLALTSGATYAGVVVSKWTPSALRVTHSGGNATIAFEELPGPVQTMFLYDPEETRELLAKGEEAVTTGKAPPRKEMAAVKPWPTKDPEGSTGPLVFTEPENTGIINTPEALSALERAIKRYDQQIAQGEEQINKIDKQIAEAVARGSSGGQRSLEKKAERLMTQLEALRAKRGELISRRLAARK